MMRLVYFIGFLVLAGYFVFVKRELSHSWLWLLVAFTLAWLLLIGLIVFPLVRLARRFPPTKANSWPGALYSAIRTLPIALLFSPTFVVGYMLGFPAPATPAILVLLIAALRTTQQRRFYVVNIIIAVICFLIFWLIVWIINFIWQSERLSRAKAKVRAIRYLCFVAIDFAVVKGSIYWYYHAPLVHTETSTTSIADAESENGYTIWCSDLPLYIIPRMCDYYRLHPECFKPTSNGEEIEVIGFAAYLKNRAESMPCRVTSKIVYDPWGDPLHFVQDLNMDGFIEVDGKKRVVLILGKQGINQEHHFGIYRPKPIKYRPSWEEIFSAVY